MDIYDISGKVVARLLNNNQFAGNYEIIIDGSKLSSGVYINRLKIISNGRYYESKKIMILLK